MKKAGIVWLICSMCFLSSCGAVKNGQRSSDAGFDTSMEETSTELIMDNLLMTIKCRYPGSQVEWTYFLLCVLSCGDVWAITYSEDDELFQKFDIGEESIWSLNPAPVCLGRLETSEFDTFKEYFLKIDRNSGYDSRSEDQIPSVEEEEYDDVHCYLPLDNGGREQYLIISYGACSGISDVMKDDNAIAALKVIQNSKLYEKWLETHVHFKVTSE